MLAMNRYQILEGHVLPQAEARGASTAASNTSNIVQHSNIRTVAVPRVLRYDGGCDRKTYQEIDESRSDPRAATPLLFNNLQTKLDSKPIGHSVGVAASFKRLYRKRADWTLALPDDSFSGAPPIQH